MVPPAAFKLPLTREQMRSAVAKGHGRAILHVAEHGTEGMEDLILHACTHSVVYDAQCEDERSPWLMRIHDAASGIPNLVPSVCDALRRPLTDERFWDMSQLCRLAGLLARRGHQEAHQALYDAFQKSSDSMDLFGVDEIIDLDGADGLIHLAEEMGRWLRAQPDLVLDDGLLDYYDSCHNDGAAIRILESVALRNPNVSEYLRHICEEGDAAAAGGWKDLSNVRIDEQLVSDRHNRVTSMSADEVIATIRESDPESVRFGYTQWGRYATDDELAVVAAKMIQEEHPGRLCKYLRVFQSIGLPHFDERMQQFARHSDDSVRRAACCILARCKHPLVRAIALEMLAEGQTSEGQLCLFRLNYEPGDYRLFERILTVGDGDRFHWLLGDMIEVFSNNEVHESYSCMLFTYEHSPCGTCRQKAVEILSNVGMLPEWVREECRHDAVEGIRDIADGRTPRED
jgi:hypothetical protein